MAKIDQVGELLCEEERQACSCVSRLPFKLLKLGASGDDSLFNDRTCLLTWTELRNVTPICFKVL